MHTTGLEISIDNSPLIIGEPAVVTCTSAIVVDELLWLKEEVLINVLSDTSSATLMFDPVNDSIHNKTFICRALQMGTVEKHITINVAGKMSFLLFVFFGIRSMIIICSLVCFVPTAPLGAVINATISHPQSSPKVGMPYNLSCLCNVSKGFVKHKPTVLWIHPNQTNFITPSIEFNVLRASDSGKYTCRVTLMSPALDMPLKAMQTYNLTIQRKLLNNYYAKIINFQPAVPAPNVSISVPNTTLLAGSTVNLTCNVILASEIDVSVTINVTWLQRSTTTLISPEPPSTSFTSILTLSPLSAADNNITCLTNILPVEGNAQFLLEGPIQSASEILNITSESII